MADNGLHRAAGREAGDGLAEFGFDAGGDRWLDHLRAAAAQPPLGRLGPYELIEEINRGGQCIVYRAFDTRARRDVAIKRLAAGSLATGSARRRFEREVEAAASLSHPNIVTVFGAEQAEGQAALVMEWIDGVPITDWAAPGSERRPARTIVEAFVTVCRAVRHAHRRGVIHRDLKPGNILVDASGAPHVLDFGIAKLAMPDGSDAPAVTRSGQFMGTPAYASPEHVRGRPGEVDVRSDVYSLGVILYELLCGELPYPVDGGLAAVFDSILRAEPRPPRRVRPDLDRELEAILQKALHKDPDERYASAEAMGDDLARHLAGAPVEARGRSAMYLARKAVGRHRVAVCVGLLLLAAAFGYAVLMPLLLVKVRDEADRARQVHAFLQDTLASASPYRLGGDAEVGRLLDGAAARLDRAAGVQPGVEGSIRLTIAQAWGSLWEWGRSVEQAERAAGILRSLPGRQEELAVALTLLGRGLAFRRDPRCVPVLEEALALRRSLYGDAHPLLAETVTCLGFAHWHGIRPQQPETAEAYYEQALAMHARVQRAPDELWARTLYSSAMFHLNQRRLDRAEPLFAEALGMYRALPDLAFYRIMCLRGMGRLLLDTGRAAEAEAALLEAESLFPEGFADHVLANVLWELGTVMRVRGEPAGAERREREALAIVCEQLSRAHPARAEDLTGCAWRLRDLGIAAPYADLDAVFASLGDPDAETWRAALQ